MSRFHRPISAFIICQNEVAVLGECIESLDFCREIVIVDSGSTDGTLALIESYAAQGYPIRLISNAWPGFARQKQFALEQCREPWCLSMDSDERLDPQRRHTFRPCRWTTQSSRLTRSFGVTTCRATATSRLSFTPRRF